MFATEAVCYLRERIFKTRIILVWLLMLAGVSLIRADWLSQLAVLGLITACFIIAFRLWDDLADLEQDRRLYPSRCLSRVQNLLPFQVTSWLLIIGLMSMLFLLVAAQRLPAYLGLLVFFFLMYRLTWERAALRTSRVALVLSKYPIFILLLADAPGDPLVLLVALVLYLLPLIDEVRSAGLDILLPAITVLGLACLAWFFTIYRGLI